MKTTIDGRVHLHGALLAYLKEATATRANLEPIPAMSADAASAAEEFMRHDDLADDDYLELEIVGHPSEDLPHGMVLLSCGPISIECCASELRRALAAFTDGAK